jgi:hypothetical protein
MNSSYIRAPTTVNVCEVIAIDAWQPMSRPYSLNEEDQQYSVAEAGVQEGT